MSRVASVRSSLGRWSMNRDSVCLALHRVVDEIDRDFAANRSLQVTRGFLFQFIDRAQDAGLRFVSLEELLAGAQDRQPQLHLSFDDGYREMHNVATELARSGIPVSLGISGGLCERESQPWWLLLEDHALNASDLRRRTRESVQADLLERRLEAEFLSQRGHFMKREVTLELNFADRQRYSSLFLQKREVSELASAAHVEISDHSYHHCDMSSGSTSEIAEDLDRSRSFLFGCGVTNLRTFVAPYGLYGHALLESLREREYHTLLTLFPGPVSTLRKSYSLSLVPRVGLMEGDSLESVYWKAMRGALAGVRKPRSRQGIEE